MNSVLTADRHMITTSTYHVLYMTSHCLQIAVTYWLYNGFDQSGDALQFLDYNSWIGEVRHVNYSREVELFDGKFY